MVFFGSWGSMVLGVLWFCGVFVGGVWDCDVSWGASVGGGVCLRICGSLIFSRSCCVCLPCVIGLGYVTVGSLRYLCCGYRFYMVWM